jgi:hypothetical protein
MFTRYTVEKHWCFFNIILILVHLLLKLFLVLFILIAIFISLKTVVVHRVEGASLRAVLLLLSIAWWLEVYSTVRYMVSIKEKTSSNKL